MIEKIKAWAYENTELWDMPLVPFVARGLSKVFPCWG